MANEYKLGETVKPDILIKKCTTGFMVKGNIYASDELRAFSTPESLIEWLSRELGAGPIVWAWTLPIWAEIVGVKEEDLLPIPDLSVDPVGYQEAQGYNATYLIKRFADKVYEARTSKPSPEPKVKKEKKVKGKEVKAVGLAGEKVVEVGLEVEEEKPKEEVKEE
jgi:hypothetical protein